MILFIILINMHLHLLYAITRYELQLGLQVLLHTPQIPQFSLAFRQKQAHFFMLCSIRVSKFIYFILGLVFNEVSLVLEAELNGLKVFLLLIEDVFVTLGHESV